MLVMLVGMVCVYGDANGGFDRCTITANFTGVVRGYSGVVKVMVMVVWLK